MIMPLQKCVIEHFLTVRFIFKPLYYLRCYKFYSEFLGSPPSGSSKNLDFESVSQLKDVVK